MAAVVNKIVDVLGAMGNGVKTAVTNKIGEMREEAAAEIAAKEADKAAIDAIKVVKNESKEKSFEIDSKINDLLTPNTKATGLGLAAPDSTNYSWDDKAKDKAALQLEVDKNTAAQDALKNRQTIEENSKTYQEQFDMQKYSNNQSAQSAGWYNDGYVLDKERQYEYLKQSIASQMYSAVELQKYGYDTSLAAARLSYDLNKMEYARQYYNDAIDNAIKESEVNGFYIAPEAKENLQNEVIAKDKLKGTVDLDGVTYNLAELADTDDGLKTLLSLQTNNVLSAEQSDAVTKLNNINAWFDNNNVSRAAQKTMNQIQLELNNLTVERENIYKTYNAAIEAFNNSLQSNNKYAILDDNNQIDVVNGQVRTGDWETISSQDLINYVAIKNSDGNYNINGYKYEQLQAYLSSLLDQTNVNFKSWCETNNIQATATKFKEYLVGNDLVAQYLQNKLGNVENPELKYLIFKLADLKDTITLPDNTSFTYDSKAIENYRADSENKSKIKTEEQVKQEEDRKNTIAHIMNDDSLTNGGKACLLLAVNNGDLTMNNGHYASTNPEVSLREVFKKYGFLL